jgi:predicted alpha-1,2-mannosidase
MNNRILLFLLSILLISCTKQETNKDIIAYVNPFIGTGGHGHTFPGATAPFGMVQLSPDTRLDGWDGCSGYHYTDSVVYGFSHTHLSGTGVSDYGDILLMPNTGVVNFDNGFESGVDNGYASRFSKKTETASAGYYAVQLADYNIGVELTASPRTGVHRYTFPEGNGHIIIDLEHRDRLSDFSLQKTGETEVTGHRISEAWAAEQHVYFVAQFSEPISNFETDSLTGKAAKAVVHFNNPGTLVVKVGISAVSIENARANLLAEVEHWDFDRVRSETEQLWRNKLQKIEVEGGSDDEKTKFYTALYHTMVAPNLFSDVNGEYRGMDRQVHKADHDVYTVFSLWDTFRAAHPLYTIIEPERTLDFIKTFLLHFEQGGRLPVWELAGNETDCMIGYHSVPVVLDAYVKGISDFDQKKMLEAMLSVSRMEHFGLENYLKNGCIMASDEPESVSKTLEYAYDDWCIAQFAKALGEEEIYKEYTQRAQYYKNLFDPESRFFRARMDGSWFGPFDPAEVNFNYTEANAWQYSLFVPQDINGLMAQHGGEANFTNHLDKLFTASSQTTGRDQADITGLIGQYAHGNEPSHHMAYLYNFVGQPHKTQERVRQIMDELYSNAPDGLSGNEDCGQMSAWLVFSAMGFYPVTPGTTDYILGSPLFNKVTIRPGNGKEFVISAPANSSENRYIQNVKLNNNNLPFSYFSHENIVSGGKLEFEMAAEPNFSWAVAPEHRPSTGIEEFPIVSLPWFESNGSTFTDSLLVEIRTLNPKASIYYRLNDEEPKTYNEPFMLKENTSMVSWSSLPDGSKSAELKQDFYKIDGSRSLTLNVTYANQYAAGGDKALIDYQRGSNNYQTGRWQGYQAQDFDAFVDLGSTKTIKSATIGFLQDIKSWIWYPTEVSFFGSTDGKNYQLLKTVKNEFPDNQYGGYTQDFIIPVNKSIRFLKITAKNYGACPDWHLGAGGQSWLFADEIVIE